MQILKFSTPTCCQCRIVEQKLKAKNIEYKDIDCTTDEGEQMAKQYGIASVPVVIVLGDDGCERMRLNNLPAIMSAIADGALK